MIGATTLRHLARGALVGVMAVAVLALLLPLVDDRAPLRAYAYDLSGTPVSPHDERSDVGALDQPLLHLSSPADLHFHGYDTSATIASGPVRLVGYRLAPNTAARGADFVVDSRGTAIPTDAGRLRAGLERSGGFQDVSTNPATSRKFVGTDHGDPIRIRVEKGHPLDPAYTGPSDPLHGIDHLHVERRANGATGPWREQWKIPYAWPF